MHSGKEEQSISETQWPGVQVILSHANVAQTRTASSGNSALSNEMSSATPPSTSVSRRTSEGTQGART